MSSSRYHVHTATAATPPAGYPAECFIAAGEAYVKYGHPVFEGKSQRGDDHWTAESITQTWSRADDRFKPLANKYWAARGGSSAHQRGEQAVPGDQRDVPRWTWRSLSWPAICTMAEGSSS